MTGSLLYLMASRPDIMFSVCLCARFQEEPKTSHLEAIKRIFQYIKGTTHLGLWYPKGTDIETVVYADSDHAGDYVDQKITSGICTFVGCCLTSWFSKKQTALAISTTEAEYDNVQKGHISIEKVLFVDNITDILTKSLKRESFNFLRLGLGMMEHIPVPTSGPYQTNPPYPDDIKLYVQKEREGRVTLIRHDKVIDVEDNQFLTREIVTVMKTWVEIIRENVFCLGGNRDHVPTCLCHMLYCIARSERYNLAYFVAKRMEFVTKQAQLILPYAKDSKGLWHEKRSLLYFLFIRLRQSSSSYLNDDNDGNDEGTSRASTPSPTRFVNSLSNDIPQIFSNPPNVYPNMEDFYTRQTEILNHQVQLRDEQRGGIRSIRKGIKNLWRKKKK
ncbi:hypothetical protein Tco_1020794 [Tanacetum coccineum]